MTRSMRKAKSMRKTKKNKMFGGAIKTQDGTDYSEKQITIARPTESSLSTSMKFKDYFYEFNSSSYTTPVTFSFNDDDTSDKKTWFLIKEPNKSTKVLETHIISFDDKKLLTDDLSQTNNSASSVTNAAAPPTNEVWVINDKNVVAVTDYRKTAYLIFRYIKKNINQLQAGLSTFIGYKDGKLTVYFPTTTNFNKFSKLSEDTVSKMKNLFDTFRQEYRDTKTPPEAFTITDDIKGNTVSVIATDPSLAQLVIGTKRVLVSDNKQSLSTLA